MATKEKKVSLEEAAKAFILLYDSNNYSSRDFDLLLGQLRDCVDKGEHGPYLPEEAEDTGELASLHATVVQQDKEGTLAPSKDGGRELARYANEKAEEKKKAEKES